MRRVKTWSNNIHLRKHLLYKRGLEKIEDELDVMHMIKSNA
jgi:hypothetical protein